MRLPLIFVFALGLSPLFVTACSAPVVAEDPEGVSADELAAMAAPGVDETALNRAADPCADFYEFACGGYIATVPPGVAFQGRAASSLRTARKAVLTDVLAAIQRDPRNEGERNTAVLYKSCMTVPDQARESAVAAAFRADIDAATTPDAIARVVGRMAKQFKSAFFGFYPAPDSFGRGRHQTANAMPGGFDFGADYATDAGRAARRTALLASITSAEPTLSADDAGRMADASIAIETTLAGPGMSALMNDDDVPRPVGQVGLAAAAPHFEWKTFFTTIGVPHADDFFVQGLDYFALVDHVLTTSSIEDIHAYLTAHAYEFDSRGPATDAFCQDTVTNFMADAIEPRFLEAAGVDAKSQAKAKALFRAIVDAFGEELDAEPFLDVATRVEAKVKLSKVRSAIGASRSVDKFDDIDLSVADSFEQNITRLAERQFQKALAELGKPVPLNHVDWTPETVNASYNGTLNKISVPGGILGGYYFSPSSPNLANFATMGTVLGHELTHGFDNNGRQFDGDGRKRDWWTPKVSASFDEKAQCLVDEYTAFTLPGVTNPATGESPAHVNGTRTLGENIADNGGVKTAFRASKVETMTTPLVAGFTPPQQFFISYAQLWCEKRWPEFAGTMLNRDGHSPGKARVNVPLQNFDAFASAFQCKPGTTMAPANRCGVW